MTSRNSFNNTPRFSILLAEDSPPNQVLAKKTLEAAGFIVDIADNGAEALELHRKKRYDLILMDMQMPVMDGFAATKKIRASETGRHIPIIAFSALPPGQYRERCLTAGLDDYVHKPFDEKILLRTLRKWIDQRPVIMVVDDSDESRALIERHVRGLKQYRCVQAANGIEAIRTLRTQQVALILMDMEMPVMDGYTATRTITALRLEPRIPIIAMTAHEGDAEVKRCLDTGCADYLRKPVRKDCLVEIVGRHLKAHRKGGPTGAGAEYVQVNADLAELIPGYLENRRKDAETISGLLTEGDFGEIRRLGHSMSGSGGGYGFPEISKLGKAIEKTALAGNEKEIRKLTARLAGYVKDVKVVLKQEG